MKNGLTTNCKYAIIRTMEKTHTQLQKGAGRVNELIIAGGTEIAEQQVINADLFTRWTSYIDAKPKTIETYTRL